MHLTEQNQPSVSTGSSPDVESISDSQILADSEFIADIPLRGRALRFVLVDELRQRDAMTVAEMVTVMAGYGFDLGGRASKVISDALRWELARRRVRRLGRGVYCYVGAPRSTARRIQIFAAACRAWLVAATRTSPANPTHQSQHPDSNPPPRADLQRSAATADAAESDQPGDSDDGRRVMAPWENLGWLWSS